MNFFLKGQDHKLLGFWNLFTPAQLPSRCERGQRQELKNPCDCAPNNRKLTFEKASKGNSVQQCCEFRFWNTNLQNECGKMGL